MNRNVIEARDLQKRYGEIKAVDGLSFSIRHGEIFGFLGPNGAGKTTTISMLSCLTEPDGGAATVAGFDVTEAANEVKRRIGLVPQDLALYPTLSGRDNLSYFGRIYGLRGNALRQRINQVLKTVELADRANSPVQSYSGGMKRRLNIAAGLLHQPEVLFLDEPTVGVDPQSRNAIFEHVERLRDEGVTVIYTTHYMEEAERLCDRVAIIDAGRIIALDVPHKLIADLGQGIIHLGVTGQIAGEILTRIRALPEIREASQVDGKIEVETIDPQRTLIHLLEALDQANTKVTSLEILEPNLETVFLHLTGRQLRE